MVFRRFAGFGGAVELGRDRIMIRFPDPRLLRIAARVTILVFAFISFTELRTAGKLAASSGDSEESCFSELLRDLIGMGLFTSGAGRAVFLGDPASQLPILVDNGVEAILDEESAAAIGAGTIDFVLASGDESVLLFANRALKIGGIAAIQLDSVAESLPQLWTPSNFRLVYTRRFISTVIAMRKVADAPLITAFSGGSDEILQWRLGRRLLALPEAKKKALNGLEDAALEPPAKGQQRRTRYLPDLLGDSLSEYSRRMFVDVGPPGRAGNEGWFAMHYPTRNLDFELIRVDVDDVVSSSVDSSMAGGLADWLRRNVREEDYVVMKAEADAVEEIVTGRAVGLIDELFLECPNQWFKVKGGMKSRRAYWECLTLYGKLRDEGVAVHQWWGR
ncbi:hypothetical protein HPP92_005778 [Vanilla planifolia]|uniref:DUF7870 domain-containing protein n=1 Tax=Vanilla planifolia TaxID=51239 RepID=A0A835RHG2_VANPL|nr:hypothetical protein HPP92_005778 [Vanilla planifolia]